MICLNPVPTLRPSHAEQGGNGNIARASQLLLGSPPSGLVVWETGWGWLDELIDLHCVWIIKFEFILLTYVEEAVFVSQIILALVTSVPTSFSALFKITLSSCLQPGWSLLCAEV